jgi:hypothetical protein
MHKAITMTFMVTLLWGISRVAGAQAALEYFDCDVEDSASFRTALGSIYEATRGGQTSIFLDQWLWNGEDPATHRVIIQHADYDAMQAWRARFAGNAAAQAALTTLGRVSECSSEGLSVFRNAWVNVEEQTQTPYFAVYSIAATDGRAYADALADLAEAQSGNEPGVVILFENRAGLHGVSHVVVVGAPTLSGLNAYLDALFASDDFADFNDEVGSIRRVVSVGQSQRIQVWAPSQ